jgi:hypothetical protein
MALGIQIVLVALLRCGMDSNTGLGTRRFNGQLRLHNSESGVEEYKFLIQNQN